MAEVTLPAVGTTAHSLMMSFQGNRIRVTFDGLQYCDVNDDGFDLRSAYTSGGISLDMFTTNPSYAFSVDNVLVLAQ